MAVLSGATFQQDDARPVTARVSQDCISHISTFRWPARYVAAVDQWSRYRTVACIVTSSNPVPLKTRRVRQRCTLNLSTAETSSRWCGVVVRRGSASSGVVHVMDHAKSPRVAEQCDINIHSLTH
ncbi:uncharacterized protein TNCV_3009331 [Trichonephila clavipes]|nr:uncharacterized protein TNCV_3009331 [Trichonephila clavipes]